MKIFSIIFFCASLILVSSFSSCEYKQDSKGNLDEIFVFADSLDWADYQDALASHFSQIIRMPTREREYILSWKPISQLDIIQNRKNIMLLATLDGKGAVSQQVRSILSDGVVESVKKGEAFYIPRKDEWVNDQYIVYLVAPTKDDMLQRIYDLGELVYDDFEKSYYQRLKDEIFKAREQTGVANYILNHYPFTLRVQHDYELVDQSAEHRYIWLRRFGPDRSLFVHWMPYEDSLKINFDWIVEQRNKLAAKIYEGDVVVEDETHLEQVQFSNRPALRMEGTWKNTTHWVGGPFRSTTFIDKKSKLVFMVDFYVNAPGIRKKPYLDQLDVMAHTFRAKSDITDASGE